MRLKFSQAEFSVGGPKFEKLSLPAPAGPARRPQNAKTNRKFEFWGLFWPLTSALPEQPPETSTADTGYCHEVALELVSGADFLCKLMCGAGPVDLRGSQGPRGRPDPENDRFSAKSQSFFSSRIFSWLVGGLFLLVPCLSSPRGRPKAWELAGKALRSRMLGSSLRRGYGKHTSCKLMGPSQKGG